jgi:hypothetical protein
MLALVTCGCWGAWGRDLQGLDPGQQPRDHHSHLVPGHRPIALEGPRIALDQASRCQISDRAVRPVVCGGVAERLTEHRRDGTDDR